MKRIEVQKVSERKYMVWVDGNFAGTYNKSVLEIKARGWGARIDF